MILALLMGLIGLAAGTPQASETAVVHGPGRLLAPVLIYRNGPDYLASAKYVVFFRTKAPFAGRTSDGTTEPGELMADDAWDNHDGFAGSIGPGVQSGKCYWWVLAPAPRLDQKRIGAKVPLRLKLHRTDDQKRSARLRALPRGYDSESWSTSPAIERDLGTIGCHKQQGSR